MASVVTDTATVTNGQAKPKPELTMQTVSDLPEWPRAKREYHPRVNPVREQLDGIEADTTAYHQFIEILVWPDVEHARRSANQKAASLRKLYKEGWTFKVRPSVSAPGRTALYAKYGE